MKCRVVGIEVNGKPVNIPTFEWMIELERRVEKLEKTKDK